MNGEIPEFRQRYRYLVGVVIVSWMILVGRLWQVQVIHGDYYRKRSEDNFVQEIRIASVRGVIKDRKGHLLATNRPSYSVFLTPHFAGPGVVERLVQELALSPERAASLAHGVEAARKKKRFSPLLVQRDINRDQLGTLEMHKGELPGVSIQARAHRNYPHGNLASHVLGYMNEISAEELHSERGEGYMPGDLVGRSGVERMYEDHLRGVPGKERIVVDARGRRKRGKEVDDLIGTNRRTEPRPGHNLVLTIDIEVQRLVERAMRHHPAGAAVVLEVNSGRILASASRPAYDPNLLSGRLSRADARRLLDDPYRPLLDKVVRENYFPGSTYKVIPAIAALEEHLVTPEETITCVGYHSFGRRNFRCSHAHGVVNIHQAIVESCNVFFYTMAERVGMDTLARYAHMFGLGSPTGLGLNGEVGGFIPTKAWYARRGQAFRVGFTLNAAIGQGNTKATPIQIANLYATIANGGTLYLPQVVERIETSDGRVVQTFHPRKRRHITISPSTLKIVRDALKGVVNEPKGTAYKARLPNTVSVSGKTGTAQVSRRARKGKVIWLQDHAWFAAYAPSDAPRIAVAVLIEHGGRAARVAAPIAMEIISKYFRYVAPEAGAAGGVAVVTDSSDRVDQGAWP